MTKGRVAFAVPGDLTTLTGGYIYDRRVMQELRDLGWQVDHIALPGGFPDPSTDEMAEALRLLRDLPPDCPVIVDGLALGALTPAGVRDIRAPVIALVHHPLAKESGLSPERQKALFDSERANLSGVAHVLVPSPHTAEILTTKYGVPEDRIAIAKPGIDQPKGQSQPVTPPLILSVGIQLPRKGHDVLLRALGQITDLDWRAIIVGAALDADFSDHLRTLLQSENLADRVTLAGQVAQEPLAALYQQASIFALATRYEGYGIVFDEALVHGLPIVTCDAGAVADTVPKGAGRLVPPDQPDAFAAALRGLLTDEKARAACAATSAMIGKTRPGWRDTAVIFANVLKQHFSEPRQVKA
ncbi:glycosyltransferase family 4 protein [Cognatiyoonia sp. IB215446]|uniref:glycosyltransferase family 4 protein n=1 Tax=Cognatiyoonia sp. IB215446 TaxID=3097355 RepID=UPI002A0BCC7C|nr:glycosyltransferase family 4 protein [Cognatiyoonia sp. IB215446]MDX8349415.1 glycosyltransferase family 4 protein [Cognatiyoonia sp. IB215446]